MKRLIYAAVTFLIAILTTQPVFSQSPSLMITDAIVSENNGAALVTIFLNEPSIDTVIVDYITEPSMASEQDFYFIAEPMQVIFAPGMTNLTLAFEIFDDTTDEYDEDFYVILMNAQGAIIEDQEGLVTILDNDAEPCISIDDNFVEESMGVSSFTVFLDVVSQKEISIDYMTIDNSAYSGIDYTSVMGTVFIPAGSMSGSSSIEIIEDTLMEIDEKFDIVLSNSVNSTICDALGTLTIVDNDEFMPPTITCPGNIIVDNEPETCGAFTMVSPLITSGTETDTWMTLYGATEGQYLFDGSSTNFNIGTTEIIFNVQDAAGNTAACATMVTVVDVEQPSFENLGPQTISTDEDCTVIVPDYTSQITAWDNCGEVVLNQTPSAGMILSEGFHEVLITATDASGNVTVDFFSLSVLDDIAPVINCQNITATLNSDGITLISVNDLIVDAWDNCGIAEIWATGSTYDASDLGENLVEVIGYDYMGNSAFCIAIVTVENASNVNDQVIGDLDFDMYPNPTLGEVVINKTGKLPGFNVRVMDLSGKIIYEMKYGQENKIKLDLNDLDSGIYTVTLSQGGESVTKKIIRTK